MKRSKNRTLEINHVENAHTAFSAQKGSRDVARTSVVCDRKGMTLDRLMRCGFPFLMEMKNGVVVRL